MVAKCHRSPLAGSSHPTISKAHHPRLSVSLPCRFCPHTSRLCLKTCINKTKSLHQRFEVSFRETTITIQEETLPLPLLGA